MQRLQGLIEYRFVEPWIGKDGHQTWRHPFGYKFTIIRDQAAEDAHAERIDNLIARCRSQVRLCAELGHFAVGGCGKRMDNEWQCERLLRLATEVSRSKERTMLIRVEVELT